MRGEYSVDSCQSSVYRRGRKEEGNCDSDKVGVDAVAEITDP
jgi:hypothetical protein